MLLIDHMESSNVINEQACQARSKNVKCCKNAAKMFDFLPHVTDEQNLASVKLVAITAWTQLFHAIVANQKSRTSQVMEWWVLRLAAWAASRWPLNSS